MMDTSPAVRCEGLGRRFGRRWVLAHVDLEIGRGESLLIAGANGSGKTTLLRVLAGLSRPNAGSVLVLGHDPHAERLTCRSRLSMVSHRSYLYDGLTAGEMLRVWARLSSARVDGDRIDSLLDRVGLAPSRDRRIGGFSAGMRKRLTLLRAQLEQPDVLLLDEPLAALDAAGQKLVETWISDELERGTTVLVASHAISRMSRLCARGLLLEDGQITWEGAATGLPAQVEEPA